MILEPLFAPNFQPGAGVAPDGEYALGSSEAALATTGAPPVRPAPMRARSLAGAVETVMTSPESPGARSMRCCAVVVNAMRPDGASLVPACRTRTDCTAPKDG